MQSHPARHRVLVATRHCHPAPTVLPPTNLSGLPFSAPYCREDNLKKGMQESADRLRKLEREYQVRRGANVLHSWLSNAALLNCFVLCSSDVDGAAAVQLV